jgi:hypothetical protein
MKRLAIVVAMVLALAVTGMAQVPMTGLTGKGIKLGVNIAGHAGDDVSEYHATKTGIAAGGYLTFSLTSAIAGQVEVLYSQKGYKYDSTGWSETGKLDYIEIPILIKYSFPVPGTTKPYLLVGPSFGMIMSAKVDWEMADDSGSLDVKDLTKSLDLGLAFGGGVTVALGTGSLSFDVRYVMGMSKIGDGDDPDTGEPIDWDIKNKTITFLVGYGL